MSSIDYEKKYLTRSKVGYNPYPYFGHKFKNSFFPYMTNLWNKLNVSTQAMQLSDFKEQIKMELKPRKHKHFSKGSKIGNKLLTRIRLDGSGVKTKKA